MFTLFVIGLTCFMASMVSAEPEAEADPQFFYNPYPTYPTYNPYPIQNTIYNPTVVQKVAKTTPVKTPITTYYPNLFRNTYYPTYQPTYQPIYQPTFRYPAYPTFRYPSYYPNVVQALPSKQVAQKDGEETDGEAPAPAPFRAIIPQFQFPNMRGAITQGVTYLRPNEGVPQIAQHDKVLAYNTVPYTQAYLNRVPVAKVA